MNEATKSLIINLAPTGMIPDRKSTPFVPLTPKEISDDVLACADYGVSMAHLHARGEDGSPTCEKEVYKRIINGIRNKRPDLIVIVSTSGRNWPEFEKRSQVLELQGDDKPDMASLTLGSMNFARSASVNAPDTIMRLAHRMRERGIKPELEVFDLGMVNYARYLITKGILEPPYYFNIILGNIASAQANLSHIGMMVSELPADSYWTLGGIGDTQLPVNTIGLAMANGVRVGLEDNIWFDSQRTVLASNTSLCERLVKIADAMQRPIAGAHEVREMLKLEHRGIFSPAPHMVFHSR